MPQMSPLSWLTLMFQFILMFMIFNVMIYYNFNKSNLTLKKINLEKFINWKW